MSHFYGTVQGGRTPATRCGHKNTGITASAQSFDGSITVRLHDNDGTTFYTVMVKAGSSPWGRIVASGPISSLVRGGHLIDSPITSCTKCGEDIHLLKESLYCRPCYLHNEKEEPR